MSQSSATAEAQPPLSPHTGEEAAWVCAQVAFEAKRYDDSIRYFNELIRYNPRLSKTQRELFSNACRRSISSARNSIQIINEDIISYEKKGDLDTVNQLEDIQKSLKAEITKACNNIIETLDLCLLPVASETQSIVFYNKIKGDYYRYLAEITPNDDTNSSRARASYEMAMKSVGDNIKMADPIYLGLILNFCVFQYEILGMKDEAIDRADVSFNEAIRYLEELDEQEYAESTTILQLLRDNIAIWREEKAEAEPHT